MLTFSSIFDSKVESQFYKKYPTKCSRPYRQIQIMTFSQVQVEECARRLSKETLPNHVTGMRLFKLKLQYLREENNCVLTTL